MGSTRKETGKRSTVPKTPQLHDEGEEGWSFKVHLGCGTVYLEGYTNIDIEGIPIRSVKPDHLEANYTTIQNYYKYEAEMGNMPRGHLPISDLQLDISFDGLPFMPGSVQKIVAIQFLEHLRPHELVHVLKLCYELLCEDGVLVATVPELLGTVSLIATSEATHSDFGIRHLLGSRKNDHAWHRTWFTEDVLYPMLADLGFHAEKINSPHFYPALAFRARKVGE